MVSTLSLEEKYSKIRRRLCFFLDIEDQELSRSLSRRLQDMGLQQEWVLSSRVTHAVVGSGAAEGTRGPQGPEGGAPRRARGSRADAMLQRCAAPPPPPHARLSVRQAISLLDKLYDTFFAAPRKSHVKYFTKDFIKIEFLDKLWRPVYKEFDEFPEFSLELDVPREKKEKRQTPETQPNDINQNITSTSQKMTRKSRPRIKEKEEKEPKGGYCEMCHADYTDLEIHRRSPQHVSFVRDANNFLALDSLIAAGADVATFLAKDAAAMNGERRSLRKICNGDIEQKTPKRSKRSQSPDSTINGDPSPPRNGIDDDRKHNTRCSKRSSESQNEDRQYYRVVGVSTKLRSSGGFATTTSKKKESPPTCNGAKPLVVKFRKVRKSELSVLSDEAEQFMFPKRASSSSSTTSSEDEKEPLVKRRPSPPPVVERRRQARPLALKEESSEEDSWPDTSRRPKRRVVVTPRRGRRVLRRSSCTAVSAAVSTETEVSMEPMEEKPPTPTPPPPEPVIEDVAPPGSPPVVVPEAPRSQADSVMRWEDGRLQYPPAVEQLEFAFESVPHSEPWFHTFQRQDEHRLTVKNVPEFFALYSTTSPKLPYEIGQLPPLKDNCCPLSALVRPAGRGRGGRGAGRGAGRGGSTRTAAYGTRGLLQSTRARRRGGTRVVVDPRPRKSPREHASTLAIAGLLRRADDSRSTASDDTGSDTLASLRRAATPLPAPPPAQHCERLREFLDDIFEDVAEFDMAGDEDFEASPVLAPTAPDVPDLVSECDACDVLRDHLREATASPAPVSAEPVTLVTAAPPKAARRQRPRKKNRTGWPSKRKTKKGSRAGSLDSRPVTDSLSGNDIMTDDESPQETEDVKTETESIASEETIPPKFEEELAPVPEEEETASPTKEEVETSTKEEEKEVLDSDTVRARRRGAGASGAVAGWLQPVVRVARVEVCARRLRSAAATARHRVR